MTEPSKLTTLQSRISTTAWAATLLLSLRGLFELYGMKQKGLFEQIVTFITDPVVHLFHVEAIDLLQIPGLAALLAAISALLVSYVLQFMLRVKIVRLHQQNQQTSATHYALNR